MAFGLWRRFLCGCMVILFCSFGMLTPALAADDAPLLADSAEYAVLVAVLFPKDEDAATSAIDAASGHKPRRAARPIRLDGITSSDYRLSRFTLSVDSSDNGSAQAMQRDFNRKNQQAYRLDEKRLLPLVPSARHVTLVTPGNYVIEGNSMPLAAGTTFLSRPGFNKDRTKAMVQINHVADPEMGVGYRVYLQKSPVKGTWIITDLELNRRY